MPFTDEEFAEIKEIFQEVMDERLEVRRWVRSQLEKRERFEEAFASGAYKRWRNSTKSLKEYAEVCDDIMCGDRE